MNDVNPEVFDSNRPLYFQLRLQQLIEIIRSNDIPRAIRFAKVKQAPVQS